MIRVTEFHVNTSNLSAFNCNKKNQNQRIHLDGFSDFSFSIILTF